MQHNAEKIGDQNGHKKDELIYRNAAEDSCLIDPGVLKTAAITPKKMPITHANSMAVIARTIVPGRAANSTDVVCLF